MYEKVVIPTDGSELAEKGVDEGVEMAKSLGVKAVAVYVIDKSQYEGLHHASIKESARHGMKEEGKEALENVREKAKKKGIELETKILSGVPYKQICSLADDNDVIYICSHGWSGFTSIFMGSTTEKVLKNSNATVSVVMGGYTSLKEGVEEVEEVPEE